MALINYEQFARRVKIVYDEIAEGLERDNSLPMPYSFQDILFVFGKYFALYEKFLGREHPPITNVKQIQRIILAMPTIEDENGEAFDILAENYPDLMMQHFWTDYAEGCDYNINHFFSGKIRYYRYMETLY
jgi:hypothetical protein